MIFKKAIAGAIIAGSLFPGMASAEYDTFHQIVYSRQMLAVDRKDLVQAGKSLDVHLSRLRLEQERQRNEQLSYGRLTQQEEDAQVRADEARTPRERERALIDRDRLRSSLEHTRIWLAGHEQDVMKSDHLVRVDQERIVGLGSAIDHLREVLKNDHVAETPATPKPNKKTAAKKA